MIVITQPVLFERRKKNIGAKLQLAETVAKTALFNNVASSRY